MQCDDVAELLLGAETERAADVEGHLSACSRCQHVASGVRRLNILLRSTLVVEPPVALQRQLADIAAAAARPAEPTWWQRLVSGDWGLGGLFAGRPTTAVAQGLAAVMLALASWQVYGWLNAFRPFVGDVGYAMELVVASPAVTYLGAVQLDVQSLGLWSLVGLGAWLFSDEGPIGRQVSGRFRRLP